MKSPSIILILYSVILFSCKKIVQPDVAAPTDPCQCLYADTASIQIEEMTELFEVMPNNRFTLTDTIMHSKSVRFKAHPDNAEYIWYIGSEIITTQSVIRYFNESLIGQNITVSCVIKRDVDKRCFPNDTGYDSLTQVFHVSQYPIETDPTNILYGPLEGTYRVKSSHLSDSFDIAVTMEFFNNQDKLCFNNYDGFGSVCSNQAEISGINYRQVFTFGGTSVTQCDYIRGNVLLNPDRSAEMNFTFQYVGHPDYEERKYLGRKL